MKLKKKIIVGFFIINMLLFVLGISNFYSITNINSNVEKLTNNVTPMLTIVSKLNYEILESYISSTKAWNSESIASIDSEINNLKLLEQDAVKQLNDFISYTNKFDKLEQQNNLLSNTITKFYEKLHSIQDYSLQRTVLMEDYFKFKNKFQEAMFEVYAVLELFLEDATLTSDAKKHIHIIIDSVKSIYEPTSELFLQATYNEINRYKENLLQAKSVISNSISNLESMILSPLELQEVINSIEDLDNITLGANNYYDKLVNLKKIIENGKNSLTRADEIFFDMSGMLKNYKNIINQEVSTYSSKSSESVKFALTLLVVVILIGSLFSCIIGGWLSRAIRIPIDLINKSLKKMTSGNLKHPVEYISDNELGFVSININKLLFQLNSIISCLSYSADKLNTAAQESSEVNHDTLVDVSHQSEKIDIAAKEINDLSLTAGEISANIKIVSSKLQETFTKVTEGKELTGKSIDEIKSLAVNMGSASKSVKTLQDTVVGISGILEVITEVAEQTNLLALNAAIEAARAGEQGRGFAVVADEVRTLAKRVQNSAQEIRDMIANLQTVSHQAVNMMEINLEKTNTTVGHAESMGSVLTNIKEYITPVNSLANEVSDALYDQKKAADVLSQDLNSIAETASRTIDKTKVNAENSKELAKIAGKLNDTVNHFEL